MLALQWMLRSSRNSIRKGLDPKGFLGLLDAQLAT
ncbi:hypothetical protein PGKDCPLP_02465 [Stenotrophomonas maltophilia]|jgi:hypothetical protein|nr:hypothetical protein PGKDCPLP_02465 [Stenotrophomonas maltophilia]